MRKRIFTFWMLLCSVLAIQAQEIRYVTEKGSGDKTGVDWENASKDLQAMIDELIDDGGEIWVKAGVYTPTTKIAKEDGSGNPTTNRDKAFRLRPNVSLYGGFNGTETNRNQRDWNENTTVLSGTLNANESAYHVVVALGQDMEWAEFDGFTITGGKADDPNVGIVYENENDFLSRVHGAGLYVRNVSSLIFNNLIIIGNKATAVGAALSITGASGELSKNVHLLNSTISNNDNLVSAAHSTVTCRNFLMENCTFSQNKGYLQVGRDRFTLNNIVVEENESTITGGLFVQFLVDDEYSEINTITVKNNVGVSGALYLSGRNTAPAKIKLKDISIVDNKGVGIQASHCELECEDLHVKRNEGSSIFGFLNTSGIFRNVTVLKNTATTNLIDVRSLTSEYASSFEVEFVNCKIAENEAVNSSFYIREVNGIPLSVTGNNLLISDNNSTNPTNEYIIYPYSGEFNLTNSTVVNNTSSGYRAVRDYSGLTITNSIIWDNFVNMSAVTNTSINNSLIGGWNLETNENLDGTDGVTYTNENMFVDYANKDYRLKEDSPVIGKGTTDGMTVPAVDLDNRPRVVDVIDLGAFEYQAETEHLTPLFEGGIKNSSGHIFTYNGGVIDLKLVNVPEGADVSYAWENKENPSETGTGMTIVNVGSYAVTAATGSFTETVDVIVQQKRFVISLADITMMERVYNAERPQERTLSADYDDSVYAGGINFEYTSSNEAIVSVSGATAIAGESGSSIIRTVTTFDDASFKRNHNVSEAMAIATVLPLVIDGNTTSVIEEETEGEGITFDEEVTIRGDVTFEDDVVFEGEVTIEGEPTNFNGGATFEDDAEINGEVKFNNPEKEVVFEGETTINGDATFAGETEFKGGASFTDEDGKTTFAGDVIFQEDVDFAGEAEFNKNATFEGEAGFGGDVSFNDEEGTVVFEDKATFDGENNTFKGETEFQGETNFTDENGKVVFDGDVVFSGAETTVTFDGETEFNGDVTFENGATFTNELPVFNGDITITGDIILPDGVALEIDNDEKTITIDGLGGFEGDVTISGGTLKVGELAVTGELTLNGVTIDVAEGAVISAETLTVGVTDPKSILDLTQLTKGTNGALTLTGLETGLDLDELFTINVLGEEDYASLGVTYEWMDHGDGSYTLQTTAQTNIPNTETPPVITYYTLKIHSTTKEGLHVWPGLGSFPVEANAYLNLDITLDEAHYGKSLSLIINGETIELAKSISDTKYAHNLRFITRDLDIEIVLKGEGDGGTTGNEVIGGDELKVYGLQGVIRVETSTPTDLAIYTVAGRPVASEKVTGTKEFYLPAGIYIVQTGTTPVKVVVR